MNEQTQQLATYINQSLQLGKTPDEITSQLQTAGWPLETVHQAFGVIQSQIVPATMQTATPPVPAPQADGKRRGRIHTGWTLFKAAAKVLNGNRYLLRYLLMTWVAIIALNAILIALIFLGIHLFITDTGANTPLWYVFVFLAYLITYFIINFYAAALASNILDIFKGARQPYATYVAAARAKAGPIFVFSLIESIVGMFLRYVVERIRFVGWLVAWLLGAAWSLGTMFVLPLIMDREVSATTAIKQSISFFKQTWGENVVSKVSVNAPLGLITIALAFLFWPVLIWGILSGSLVLFLITLFVYVFIQLSVAILGSFANSVLNVALYFYAVNRQVPPTFSSDMLNQVFVQRKHLRKKSGGALPN